MESLIIKAEKNIQLYSFWLKFSLFENLIMIVRYIKYLYNY